MVSADNLNLDILELIFAYLSGKDLPAVVLVSKAFLAGAIPRLYRTLAFRLHHAKRYPKIGTAFATIVSRPALAVHVRNVDIRATPMQRDQVEPAFMRDCVKAIRYCENLRSFTYTQESLPAFLAVLQEKTGLEELRVHAKLTTEQAKMLAKLKKVQSLTLDNGSWNVMDVLPSWTQSLERTLTSLTLYMSTQLNECVLEAALSQLPRLQGLHVIACPNVNHQTVLRLTKYTPKLESLAFTASTVDQNADVKVLPSNLLHLRHLALDVRASLMTNPVSPTLSSVLSHVRSSSPPIRSFSIKVSDLKGSLPHPFVDLVLDAHASSLRRLAFFDCTVEEYSVKAICERCTELEHLTLLLPTKDISSYTSALAGSRSLLTIVDVDAHLDHLPRPSLTTEGVKFVMSGVPNLKKIVSDQRVWTRHMLRDGRLHVLLDRQSAHGVSTHWFAPRE